MDRKQSNEQPDIMNLAFKGMIPWSTKEFYDVFAKYAAQKREMEADGEDTESLLIEVFQKEYPNTLQSAAHLWRFRLMQKFIFQFGRQMVQDGFSAPDGQPGLRNELMDILCTLPYSKEEPDGQGGKIYNFSYPEVKAAALKKINAHLN